MSATCRKQGFLGSVMSNLKTVLGVYGSVFVSLLILGAVQGSAGRNAGAKLFITQNLFLKQIGQTDLGEARFGLTYSCEEYPNSHVYDVESKSLVMSPDYDFAVLSGKLKGPMADLSSNRDLLLAFAGGPTGVMTLTWMSELKKSNKKPGTITYTILSALGGYLFGY